MALEPQCMALSGGVGGAKLALGLSLELAADHLSVIVNTGDDFDHLGLRVCPDLDTLMYTLSGKANQELGWGQASETWSFLSALSDLGGEDWFKLGDRDLATHVLRTQMLGSGSSLTDATRALMTRFPTLLRTGSVRASDLWSVFLWDGFCAKNHPI